MIEPNLIIVSDKLSLKLQIILLTKENEIKQSNKCIHINEFML